LSNVRIFLQYLLFSFIIIQIVNIYIIVNIFFQWSDTEMYLTTALRKIGRITSKNNIACVADAKQ